MNSIQSVNRDGLTSGKTAKPIKKVINEVCGYILLLERSTVDRSSRVEGHITLDYFSYNDPLRYILKVLKSKFMLRIKIEVI